MEQLDAYEHLLAQLNIDHEFFLDIGIKNILQINPDIIEKQWESHKDKCLSGKAELGIRSYGRSGKFNEHFKIFYKELLDCTILIDKTNNAYPAKMMNQETIFRKNKKAKSSDHTIIFNYQLAHIFGRTKNPLLFTALWNLAYIPKYLDPFTGHETKGSLSDKIRNSFQKAMGKKLRYYLEDYNALYHSHISPRLESAFSVVENEIQINEKEMNAFRKAAMEQWNPFEI